MILTDDEIRIAAQQWVSLTDAPNPNATSFAAGAKFVLRKLQQTACKTQLPLHDENGYCRVCGRSDWYCDSDSHK